MIIPTYNRREYILRAVQSVMAQDFPYFDLTIVDDGSTDQTAEVGEVGLVAYCLRAAVSRRTALGSQSPRVPGSRWATHRGTRCLFSHPVFYIQRRYASKLTLIVCHQYEVPGFSMCRD